MVSATPFAVTTVWGVSNGGAVATVSSAAVGQFDVRIIDTDYPATMVNRDFHFVAVGQ